MVHTPVSGGLQELDGELSLETTFQRPLMVDHANPRFKSGQPGADLRVLGVPLPVGLDVGS